jgi:hypothetical protein
MKSEDKKRPVICQQRTASIAPGLSSTRIESPVVKADSRSAGRVRTGGSGFLDVTPPQSGFSAPEEIFIDVDTYGDGMAFRFTWR